MSLTKKTIKGKKGKTVCYQLKEFDAGGESFCSIYWEPFNFYTPLGDQTDTAGHKYFEVPGLSEVIERDDTLDKEIIVKVTKTEGIEIIEILDNEALPSISIGLEGDIVCTVCVPTDPEKSISITYKEVTDG